MRIRNKVDKSSGFLWVFLDRVDGFGIFPVSVKRLRVVFLVFFFVGVLC